LDRWNDIGNKLIAMAQERVSEALFSIVLKSADGAKNGRTN
jgi:hypothetical protein